MSALDDMFEHWLQHPTLKEHATLIGDVLREYATILRERNELREALRRYIIYTEVDGYEQLSKEFGACKHPESSIWMEEWLDKTLRNPAKKALENK